MTQIAILKLAKKKKKLTVRDVNYWDLEELMHKGLLNKSYTVGGRGSGWPTYALSRRGRKSLEKMLAK